MSVTFAWSHGASAAPALPAASETAAKTTSRRAIGTAFLLGGRNRTLSRRRWSSRPSWGSARRGLGLRSEPLRERPRPSRASVRPRRAAPDGLLAGERGGLRPRARHRARAPDEAL